MRCRAPQMPGSSTTLPPGPTAGSAGAVPTCTAAGAHRGQGDSGPHPLGPRELRPGPSGGGGPPGAGPGPEPPPTLSPAPSTSTPSAASRASWRTTCLTATRRRSPRRGGGSASWWRSSAPWPRAPPPATPRWGLRAVQGPGPRGHQWGPSAQSCDAGGCAPRVSPGAAFQWEGPQGRCWTVSDLPQKLPAALVGTVAPKGVP